MTLNLVPKTLWDREDNSDDVYTTVTINLSALADFVLAAEEAARAAQRQNADKLFLDTLRKETFGGE